VRTRSIVIALIAALVGPTLAHAQADFFKGKTVTILIGSRLTGSLSIAAQLVSRHLGAHIPGNPNVIIKPMPGGAHLNATNFVFNVAEPDGLTILAANPQVAMAQIANVPAVRFDARKFEWLGSTGSEAAILGIRPDLPYKTFADFKNGKQQLIAGTTGPGSNAHDVPLLLKEFAGAPFKLVSGYAANADIRLALERREVDSWTSMATTMRLAAEQGVVRLLVRSSRAPVPGLNDLPVDEDLAESDLGRALMVIRGTPLAIGRPFAVRPGTPADRVAALREALARVVADEKFLADTTAAQIEIRHITADDVAKGFAAMIGQPPEVLAAMRKYLKVGE
jgi:tripartite-type tricarboxylate transporter receptor subunit TctC